jgi:LDH2 family malate/lactate/ureidoglycolate dehydrogenase
MLQDVEHRIQAARLDAFVASVFRSCDMSPEDAALLAHTLVFADRSGVHSHGVMRVPEYVHTLTKGGVNPKGRPKVVRDMGSCTVVDGGNSMGQIGGHFAMQHAIERAKTTGLAAVAVRGSNHCGAMAYYAMLAVPHDMIGIATTNALPTMAPWGGAARILGINPLGVAMPADQHAPLVYDAAFSGSSHGKIRIYQQKGMTLPEGWALDADGRPTTDPARAIDGLLAPIGGFKGTGLALIMGILASMLSGAAYGTELGDMDAGPRPGEDGHFFMALRIGGFADPETFKTRVDKAIDEIHRAPRAPGFDRIFAPGELEAMRRAESDVQGIPLNAVTVQDLLDTGRARGLTESFL